MTKIATSRATSTSRSHLKSFHRSILELGCGTGKNTRWLSEIGARVEAIDFSPAMIERAQARHSFDNVKFTLADLTQPWPIVDQTIDLISCNLVLEHIQDLSFIFAEAARVLIDGGQFFISELHAFRQYEGVAARFELNDRRIEIPAFVHHISDFLNAAAEAKLSLIAMNEWWHPEDANRSPRLISFMFRK
jgi:ubiquinone/menaquinone biosynthesis C-methylase UbiE